MADNVIRLVVDEVGDGMKLSADKVLAAASEEQWDSILIVGMRGGEFDVRSTDGRGDSLYAIERAKLIILGAD